MKFTGHERDLGNLAGTGDDLDSMHARHYSPLTGRFLSTDSIGGNPRVSQGWNRFSYVMNRPVIMADPSGRSPWLFLGYQALVWANAFTFESSVTVASTAIALTSFDRWLLSSAAFQDLLAGAAEEYSRRVPRDPGTGFAVESDPCAFLIPAPSPPDTELSANMSLARAMSPLEFYQAVKTGGVWDYKHQNPNYADFGNFNFGLVASARGLGPGAILAGAAAYQMYSDARRGRFTPRDNPEDPPMIVRGTAYYNYSAEGICRP
jgi:RHS repeat-associated protein